MLELFLRAKLQGKPLEITHPEMTRYLITLDQAAEFILKICSIARNGEVYLPKMAAFRLGDVIQALDPVEYRIVGVRPGERLHEQLFSEAELARVEDMGEYYVIRSHPSDGTGIQSVLYSKDAQRLSIDQLRQLISQLKENRYGLTMESSMDNHYRF